MEIGSQFLFKSGSLKSWLDPLHQQWSVCFSLNPTLPRTREPCLLLFLQKQGKWCGIKYIRFNIWRPVCGVLNLPLRGHRNWSRCPFFPVSIWIPRTVLGTCWVNKYLQLRNVDHNTCLLTLWRYIIKSICKSPNKL